MTPLMKQYWEIKNQHQDKILLYRMGDFYEMFYDDAIKAAPILNIALTARNKSAGQEEAMCGFPHHSIGSHINKLLAAGLKIAICDQVEDAKEAKTIVKRAVTRVVTPGMVYDPDTLIAFETNFVASILKNKNDTFNLAAIDVSTGEVLKSLEMSLSDLSLWTQKLNPKEYLLEEKNDFGFLEGVITVRKNEAELSVEEFLIEYVKETQGVESALTLRKPAALESEYLKMSAATLRHLELFKSNEGEKEQSVFWLLDRTKTAMGSRLFKTRLATPFIDQKKIEKEYDEVEKFIQDEILRKTLRENLSQIGDFERKVSKLSNPLCNARDLKALARALEKGLEVLGLVKINHVSLNELKKAAEKINQTFEEELPHSIKEGGFIRKGVNSTLDEYIELSTHGQRKLSELENKEREASGIQSLKIKYNSVFGYSFEVTKANLEKVPAHFVRRQTLAQAERFVTSELSDLEQKILSSQQKRYDLEYQIFQETRQLALKQALVLLNLSSQLAVVDLHQAFAELASTQNYVRPQIGLKNINLKDSRHPVLEIVGQETFIANDIKLGKKECLLLTGPNMAGKSTLMRQVALTAILAQCGSFVPAAEVQLPLFDQIFTRIGASDNLNKGLSTFMVEMTETSEIIKSATSESLVILDEIGRGTSTYDGMSLAQAVLEYFVKGVQAYTFFATHYHELTELENHMIEIKNGHMSIHEQKGELVFLRKLVFGPANRSYGIEVARLAGLPHSITTRAQYLLKGLISKARELENKQLNLLDHVQENKDNEDYEKLKQSHDYLLQAISTFQKNLESRV